MIKIICINDDDQPGLKIGEVYYTDFHYKYETRVIDVWNLNYEKITNDGYYAHRFITLAEWREKQIEDILK